MSNFQRTRSKVWWGDSPPNIGSPLPARERLPARRQDEEEEWEPQLPRWVGEAEPEEGGAAGGDEVIETPPLRRHSSPNSHKSQDSGFSDSDSSPPQVQAQTPPHNCRPNVQDNQPKTPSSLSDEMYHAETPVRSIIKTPRDLHNYLEAHCDVGHVAFKSVRQDVTLGSRARLVITPHKNINNNNIVMDKCSKKKKLLDEFNEHSERKVHLEYIQDVYPHHRAGVDNHPGVRSPVYLQTHQETGGHFERQHGFNRSFHSAYSSKRVDEQLLDEECHSLGYIDMLRDDQEEFQKNPDEGKLFSSRKITDSLHLKKSMLKTKQKIQHKAMKMRQNRGIFSFMPKKNESIKTIYDITKDSDRIPTLGLPENQGSIESLRLHRDEVDTGTTRDHPRGILKTPTSTRKFTPPLQFQDNNGLSERRQNNNCDFLMRHESSSEDLYFSEQDLSGVCTSTPKTITSSAQSVRQSNIKPTNLLDDFNRSTHKSYEHIAENGDDSEVCLTALERACRGREVPMQQWLCQLAGTLEGEVGTLLQSKPIGRLETATISHTSLTITGNIRKVHTHALIITHNARNIIKELESGDSIIMKQRKSEISSVAANMNDFVMAHSITLKIRPPKETPDRWDKISTALEENIQRADEVKEDIHVELNETNPEMNVLRRHLQCLYEIFSETTRAVLLQQMRTLTSLIEDPPSDTMLKSTLTSLGQLGRCNAEEEGLCSVPLIQCGVPRALLELIIHSGKSSVKALSLRALATICTTSEAVQQFDEAGGLEIVCDVLAERNIPEPQVREAVTVLAQVTAPWLQGHYYLPSLHKHLDTIVKNLTRILSETCCCQLLLLCAAALVNVVRSVRREGNTSTGVITALRDHRTLDLLLEAVKRRGPHASVFLQEQVAAFLDLVTCCAAGRNLACGCSASCVALLCFLRPTPPATPRPPPSPPLQQAELRLLTHTAEALARLCTIPEVCERVVHLEGPSRLVHVILSGPPRAPLVPLLRALRSLHHAAPNSLPVHLRDHVKHMLEAPLMEAVTYYQHRIDIESYV